MVLIEIRSFEKANIEVDPSNMHRDTMVSALLLALCFDLGYTSRNGEEVLSRVV